VKNEEIEGEDKKYNKMSGGKEEYEIAKASAIERSIIRKEILNKCEKEKYRKMKNEQYEG
jgi:hypothetical protein